MKLWNEYKRVMGLMNVYWFRTKLKLRRIFGKEIEKKKFAMAMPKVKEPPPEPAAIKFIKDRMGRREWTAKRAVRAWQRKQGRHPLHREHFGTFSPIRPLVGDR